LRSLDQLRLLASALAGRTLEVAAAEPGELPWTDGSTVFIDAETVGAHTVEALAVQASLLAAGSLDPRIVRRLVRHPALARRYLAVEAHRALVANEDVLPARLRRLVDHEVAAGLAAPDASLARARSRQPIVDAPPTFGTIRARRLLAAWERAEHAHRDSGADPATPAARAGDRGTLTDLAVDDDFDDLGHLLTSPVGGGGAIGRLLRRLLAPARSRGGGPAGADAPTHVATDRPGTGRRAASSTPPSRLADMLDPRRVGATYPEWDAYRRRYRPDWCTVTETDPPPGGEAAVGLADGLAFRRPLARLGVGLARCRRQPQGEDIDIDAAVEARVDALAGSPRDDDFYVATLRRRRDLAVLVLLDVSGSAGEPGVAGKIVHEHQRAAAVALTAALHELGDRVALYGFNSRGRKSVHLLRVKAFDDHLDGDMARRLSGLTPGAFTRVGAAIRHGTTILEDRAGTARRLLVVLSDGFAYDHGYAGRYGEADAQRALAEARHRGIGCLCLSVGADTTPAALQRVFGAAAHANVPGTDSLAGIIGPLFRAALRSADSQRRTFRRKERTKERLELEGRGDVDRATVLSAHR
jgi:Mg-chelatase subunit ChlD